MIQRARLVAGALAVGLTLTHAAAVAQTTPDNEDALRCQNRVSRGIARLMWNQFRCVQKCVTRLRKTMGPYAECRPPYLGPTAECMREPLKGAEAKARYSIATGCFTDCPDCYADGFACPDGAPFVGSTEGRFDVFGELAYCLEGADATPTMAQARCEDYVMKALAKYVMAANKCYVHCVDDEFAGEIPPDSCVAPTPSDEATQTCLATAAARATAVIDKTCAESSGNPPCYGVLLDSGMEWAALFEAASQVDQPLIYCGP